jgi:lysophospholipase L1-like esterase
MPQWASAQAKASFPLKDGDTWVLAGDSITHQYLHTNYFEAFCYARYPNMKFCFRAAGVGGATVAGSMGRFDYDIARWNPTVVSLEFGMNDQGSRTPDKFIADTAAMVERIRAIKARPVIFSPSPMNNGDTLAKLAASAATGGNKRLHEFALALKDFAAKENIPYADQFHALVDVWGNNKPKELLAGALPALKQLAADDSLAGVDHLRAFLTAQEKLSLNPISMQGDPVHPGPPGHLMMAAALLKELGADGFVSSATLDAGGKVTEAKGCKVDDIKAEGEKIEFDRLDERLPFPLPDAARSVLPLCPTFFEMSQYMLTVTGLKDGNYVLKVGGIAAATLTAKELAAGVNLTAVGAAAQGKDANPIVAQGRAILDAVGGSEYLANQTRALAQKAYAAGAAPELKDELAAAMKKVDEADEKTRLAAKPVKLHFELSPVK